MRTALVAAVLAAIALPAVAQNSEPAAKCRDQPLPPVFEGLVFAGDGDTIYGAGFGPGIRLWGIQASELRDQAKAETVPGMRARAAMEDLLAPTGHKARCEPLKWDRYCRVVASCSAGGVDLSLALLQQGLAYGFYLADANPATAAKSVAYAAAEFEARKAGKGLWPVWLGTAKP